MVRDPEGYRHLNEGQKVQFEIRMEADGRKKAYEVMGADGKPLPGLWADETPLVGTVAR